MTDIPRAVTIKEVMIATGKSRSTVYEMLQSGDLPGYRGKAGGWVIPRPWFEDYLHGRWVPEYRRTMRAPVVALHQRAS